MSGRERERGSRENNRRERDGEREREGGGRENNRRERDGRTVSTCSLEHTTTADVH